MLSAQNKKISFIILLIGTLVNQSKSVELKEFQHTLKIVHDTCQSITKISEDSIQELRNGNFVDDRMVKCFVHCSLEMLHLIEGSVGQFHVADKHTDYMIPNELFETTIKAFGHCEASSQGFADNCDAAYAMLKCFREGNTDFWLP